MDDLANFVLPNLVALGLAAVWLVGVRLLFRDGPDATSAVILGTLPILSLGAIGCSLLIADAYDVRLACLLTFFSGCLLTAGAWGLFSLLVPKSYEAMGPAAMGYLFVVPASLGAIPLGLFLRMIVFRSSPGPEIGRSPQRRQSRTRPQPGSHAMR